MKHWQREPRSLRKL